MRELLYILRLLLGHLALAAAEFTHLDLQVFEPLPGDNRRVLLELLTVFQMTALAGLVGNHFALGDQSGIYRRALVLRLLLGEEVGHRNDLLIVVTFGQAPHNGGIARTAPEILHGIDEECLRLAGQAGHTRPDTGSVNTMATRAGVR